MRQIMSRTLTALALTASLAAPLRIGNADQTHHL